MGDDLINLNDYVSIAKGVSETLAIIGGGFWAYYNYFRGRVYKLRLEVTPLGKILKINEEFYIIADLKIKNVGLSKIKIKQEGTAIKVFLYKKEENGEERYWNEISVLPIFECHEWIEPGESVEEKQLIPLDVSKCVAVRLDVRIVSTSEIEWNATDIISYE